MTPGASGPQPVDANNLYAAYSQICLRLAQITASPQPSYSENGRSMSWGEYQSMLITKQKELLQAIQMANGPFEIPQRMKA